MDMTGAGRLLVTTKMTIIEAMNRLNETAERILFVIDEKNFLLGTITDGDIRRGLINGVKFSETIEKVIHRKFIMLPENEIGKIDRAKKIMIEKEIEQIPVVDRDGRITEILFWRDIFGSKKEAINRKPFSNKVVIMAGGKGGRLDPFTKILPKPLIPIGEKPVVELIMEEFSRRGFRNFIFTLNYKKEYIKTFLTENDFDYGIDWVEEKDYFGTAGSISLLKDKVSDTFFVTNCDIILDSDYADILNWHKAHKNIITIIGCHKEIRIPYGILEADNGVLCKFVEKPHYDVLVNTGVYVLEPSVIPLIPKNKCMDMNALIELAGKKGKVSIYPIHKGWFDIGQWDEYKKSMKRFSDTMELGLEV